MKLDFCGNDWPVAELGADALENVSRRIRKDYMDLISRLSLDRHGDLDWWVTSLASRNTYACPLYLRLCQLMLVRDLCVQGRVPAEIVTESAALASQFRKMLGSASTVTLAGKKNLVARMLGFSRRYGASLYHVLGQFLGAAFWLKNSAMPKNGALLADIFLGPDNFAEGQIEDRYYPGLLETLDESERHKLVYTPIHYKVKNYAAHYQKINTCRDRLLLKEQVLTLADYIYALLHPFRLRWPARKIEFLGLDVGEIVREALADTFANSSSMEGLLRYRFAMRLQQRGFTPGVVIEWFENQEVDHGAIAGWREFFPEVEVLGYQGFLASPHYLSALPIALEQQYSLLPTRVVVMGENQLDSTKAFAPELNVVTGPAFRFASLWNEIEFCGDRDTFNVVVALPIHFQESDKIISVLAEAVAQGLYASPIKIFIKPHPTWNRDDVRRLVAGRDFRHEVVNATFDDALAMSDLVISAASSVCVFAVARAVPCIVIGTPGALLQNSIPEDVDRRLWKACYTASEASRQIEYYLSLSSRQKADLSVAANAFRDLQFVPVTRQTVSDFIGIVA